MVTPRVQETRTYQISTTNDNHTHVVRDGANRVLLVEMMGRFASVTSISYGGNALTQVVGANAGAGTAGTTHRHVDLWYLIAPTVGSATLNVQISGNTQGTVRVRNMVDVNQSTPLRSQGGSNYAVSASGTSSTGDTLTPTTAADDLVLDLIAVSTTPTIGSGQTLAGFGTQPTNQRSSTRVATGGSENMAWTYSSGTFAHCAVSIIGSAATQPDPADFGGTAGKKSWHVSSNLTGESVSSGATVYVSLAPGIESSGTETLNRTRMRVPGTISDLSITVSVNATTSDSTVTVLEDGSSAGVTITIPAGTTGTFAASGDVSVDGTTALSLQVTNGGGGSLTMNAAAFAFEADDAETMTLLAAHSSSALQTSAATTTYLRASGSRGSDADETDATIRVPIAATWEGIEVIKVGNTTTATVDVESRISGASGNQALSWASSGASSEEDTTNSDTLADGDDIAWQIVAGAGSGTWETERWTSRLLTSNGRFLFVAGGVPGDGLALSNGLNYIPLAGELKVTTTEANAQQEAPFDLTAYRLAVAVGTNTSLLPTMVRLRVNGADASQWVELQPGIADVYYADVWATDDVDAGDLVCIEADCAGANSTVRIRYVALVGVERSAAPAQHESGGASSAISVSAAGAGTAAESASGGASGVASVSAGGAGAAAESASGGASATVTVTAAGEGTSSEDTAEHYSGGASAVVGVTSAGAGTAAEAASGGSAALVDIIAAGVGVASEHATGGEAAIIWVRASGAGVSSEEPEFVVPDIWRTVREPAETRHVRERADARTVAEPAETRFIPR